MRETIARYLYKESGIDEAYETVKSALLHDADKIILQRRAYVLDDLAARIEAFLPPEKD